MRIFIFTVLVLLLPLNTSAQIPSQSQKAAATQDAKQNSKPIEDLSPEPRDDRDERPNPTTQEHEASDSKSNKKFEHVKTPLFEASDWIAIILGLSAIALSWWGLRQNRISNEKQNRAYLTVTECRLMRTNNGLAIKYVLKNVGATPANVTSTNNWYGFYKDYQADLSQESKIEPTLINLYIGPSDQKSRTIFIPVGQAMPEHIYDALEAGNMTIMLDGVICFTDEFNGNHEVRFHFKKRKKPNGLEGPMDIAKDGITSTAV